MSEVRPAALDHRPSPAWPFVLGISVVGGCYVLMILALLVADLAWLDRDLAESHVSYRSLLQKISPEIRYAAVLSLVSCAITAILSVWVAVPLGYLLSRYRVPGKRLIDALIDIPVVLPPLVIGLSLLIFFQTPPGRFLEFLTREKMGPMLIYAGLPLVVLTALVLLASVLHERLLPQIPGIFLRFVWPAAGGLAALVLLWQLPAAARWSAWCQQRFGTGITYAIPSVILAQFSVACAFAVRTMKVTFDQITPRREQVALTLGCSPGYAFWHIAVPESWHGIVTAGSMAWARALGEFGPVLIFSGATRLRTEVLPTTIFLELSVGSLRMAVAVSLAMVVAAVIVLIVVRLWGVVR